ncbi:MAG: ABC transporter permease, partial [Alphaproteobacteria bacterium]
AELGLKGFTLPMKGSCKNHGSGGAIVLQQWDGEKFNVISDPIPPMAEKVRAMLEEAAEKYIADKPDWQTQKCEG